MSPSDDVYGKMRKLPFDSATADALLSGMIAPEDAPPGLQEVAALVRAARTPPLDGPLPDGGVVVAAFAGAARARQGAAARSHSSRRPILGKHLFVKVAAGAAVLSLCGTAAAAATGSLPAAIQSSVADVAYHVGLSLPNPSKDASHHGVPPGVHANASGLCTAYASVTRGFTSTTDPALSSSKAFARLAAAATAKSETVKQYCADVTAASGAHPSSRPGASHKPAKPATPAKISGSHRPRTPGVSHNPAKTGGTSGTHRPRTPGASHNPIKPAGTPGTHMRRPQRASRNPAKPRRTPGTRRRRVRRALHKPARRATVLGHIERSLLQQTRGLT